MGYRDLQYEQSNIGYNKQYLDGGIKCKNYELCEDVLPKWWFECKGNYLCTNCHMMFGTWKFKGQEYKTGKGILDNYKNPILDLIEWIENSKNKTLANKYLGSFIAE